MRRTSLGGIIYLIVGILVASSHGYLTNLNSFSNLLSLVVAVALWPVLLFGANLHLAF